MRYEWLVYQLIKYSEPMREEIRQRALPTSSAVGPKELIATLQNESGLEDAATFYLHCKSNEVFSVLRQGLEELLLGTASKFEEKPLEQGDLGLFLDEKFLNHAAKRLQCLSADETEVFRALFDFEDIRTLMTRIGQPADSEIKELFFRFISGKVSRPILDETGNPDTWSLLSGLITKSAEKRLQKEFGCGPGQELASLMNSMPSGEEESKDEELAAVGAPLDAVAVILITSRMRSIADSYRQVVADAVDGVIAMNDGDALVRASLLFHVEHAYRKAIEELVANGGVALPGALQKYVELSKDENGRLRAAVDPKLVQFLLLSGVSFPNPFEFREKTVSAPAGHDGESLVIPDSGAVAEREIDALDQEFEVFEWSPAPDPS